MNVNAWQTCWVLTLESLNLNVVCGYRRDLIITLTYVNLEIANSA